MSISRKLIHLSIKLQIASQKSEQTVGTICQLIFLMKSQTIRIKCKKNHNYNSKHIISITLCFTLGSSASFMAWRLKNVDMHTVCMHPHKLIHLKSSEVFCQMQLGT